MRARSWPIGATSFVSLIATCLATLAAASSPVQTAKGPTVAKVSTTAAQSRQLTGDVFIVTVGGSNYKLGLVTVLVITEDGLKKHLDRKKRASEAQVLKLRPEVENLKTEYKVAKDERDRLYKVHYDDAANKEKEAAFKEAAQKTLQVDSKLSDAERQLDHFSSAGFLYEGLPALAVSTAKTDADGKFTVQAPRQERFAVAARSARGIGSTKEEYFWMVWVDAQTKRLMLSNDNMVGQGSPESALK